MKGDAPELLSTDKLWKPADNYKYTASPAANVRSDVSMSGAAKIAVMQP